jgi:hypothetical protein
MRRLVLFSLALLPLPACGGGESPYVRPNDLMASEISNRVTQIPFQHRDELFQNLLWLAQSGEQAIPDLLTGLRNDNAKVRSSCAWVLGRISDRRTIPDLQRISKDANATVRMEVARTLVVMGDIKQSPTLIEGLDSDRTEIRFMCNEALKDATGRDFGFDHLSEDLMARRSSVLEWRTWWSELSGDSFFASAYAVENGLNQSPEGMPAAPIGETRREDGDDKDGTTDKKEIGKGN